MTAAVLALLACSASPSGTDDTGGITRYVVTFGTDPSPPVAGEEARFEETVSDQDGNPVEDLQASHERMIHTVFISSDLRWFLHLHQEDVTPITADDLRAATFHFPVTFPVSGDWSVGFDFAHRDQWLAARGDLDVVGAPPAEVEPDLTRSETSVSGGVVATLRWDEAPYAGVPAAFTVILAAADGTPVEDLTQWLGADGHAVMVSADRAWIQHTHAWFPGMEDMTPGHPMPHRYDGPEVPFHHVFTEPGPYRVWAQFTRAAAPDEVLTFSWAFDVGV